MARMIPSTIDRTDPRRKGEYMVFDWLSNPAIPGVCFYSLPQEKHPHKLIGEVDFLYICEKGMLCIEVKGGIDIYRTERKWYSVNKRNVANEIHDPFEQSRGCMFALKKLLKDTYGKNSNEAKLQTACCVVFPECIAKCKGEGVTLETMYDNRFNLNEFPTFLEKSIEYWAELEKEKHNGIGSNPLSVKQIKQMVDLLQADFGSIPSMKLEIQHVEDQMLQLSEEQMDVIEDMNENRRVLVQGGAGTGKSLLAIEKARRALASGKSVLYLCYNRNMAQYALMNLPAESDELKVCTIHSLLGSYMSGDVSEMQLDELISNYHKSHTPIDRIFDVLVVDEGQDLMYDYVWETIDPFLNQGIESGEWIVFTDPNQSIFTDNSDYKTGLEYLKEFCAPTIWTLRKNWRNTAQIGRKTTRLTLVPLAKHMKIDGPNVVVRKVEGTKDLQKQLKKDISAVLSGGTPSKNIVILSPKRKQNSAIADLTKMHNMDVLEVRNLYERKDNQINYFTAQSYKGLESSVVFYIDVNGFKSDMNRKMNYVAMSRARALLYMYVDDSLDEEYFDMMDEGLEVLES